MPKSLLMQLTSGSRIGPYEILSPLGAGGMGEVYLARDAKLNREVAIKGLPEAFAREAQVLAALNHPNIAAIYGLEESRDQQFLVMEYVAGEPLRGPVPVEEALTLAKQLVEALEAAHEKGIVHRDLKPDNIKVTPEGKVKVLDFGLAKAMEESSDIDLENSPTISEAATRAGVILGTAAYMSPEQARGKPVDRRADVWAFGCVMYELLTGKRAFTGDTITDLTVAIMTREPDWSRLPAATPPRVRELLQRCLQKDPQRRLKYLGDTLWEMEQPAPVAEALPIRVKARRTLWPWFVAAAAAIAFTAGFWIRSRVQPPEKSWTGVRLGGPSIAWTPRISPDGKMLAFLVHEDRQSQVAVMNPQTGNWTILTHDRSNGIVGNMSWSRDSSWIYFDRIAGVNKIFRLPALGGEVQTVLEDAMTPAVLPDGSLLALRRNSERKEQLQHFWPETGRLEALPAEESGDTWTSHHAGFADGREAVFFGRPLSPAGGELRWHYYILDLISGAARPLAPELKPPTNRAQLAVDPGGQSVVVTATSGDLMSLVEVPLSGRGSWRTLISLLAPGGVDIGPDGSLYVDQQERLNEILRFPASGGVPERQSGGADLAAPGSAPLPDGRILSATSFGGRWRLMAARVGKDPTPFVQTEEESGWPFVVIGEREVAFEMGTSPNRTLAVASASDGRMIRRLSATKGLPISSLASSFDGSTLYYVVSGTIWLIPAAGGDPRKIGSGDEVATDPNGGQLIAMRYEKDGVGLVRLSLPGGAETPIPIHSDFHLLPGFSGSAVHRDGRILLAVQSPDSWWDEVAILDPTTGKLKRLDVPYAGDIDLAGWTRDGQIMAVGLRMQSSLWRFRREKP
jgi:serine/threonine protein kinase/DNA-binding beta-propeller fold protein YncE